MANRDFNDLNRRAGNDKLLRDKAFNIAKNPKDDGNQCGPALIVYKFFNQKKYGETVKNKIIPNKKLAKEFENLKKIKYNNLL